MNKQKVSEILNNYSIYEVFYKNKPIWIQKINNNFAQIGFLDGSPDQNVNISNLYEK